MHIVLPVEDGVNRLIEEYRSAGLFVKRILQIVHGVLESGFAAEQSDQLMGGTG